MSWSDWVSPLANAFIPGSGAILEAMDKPKVKGVPTPDGAEVGRNAEQFFDAAYPGTSPWERLGATGSISSGGGVAEMETKVKQDMQQRDLDNQREVNDSTNRAHIIGALGSIGPNAVDGGLTAYSRSGVGGTPAYDSFTQQGRDKTPAEIAHLKGKGTVQGGPESLLGIADKSIRDFGGWMGTSAGDFTGKHIDPILARVSRGAGYIANGLRPKRASSVGPKNSR